MHQVARFSRIGAANKYIRVVRTIRVTVVEADWVTVDAGLVLVTVDAGCVTVAVMDAVMVRRTVFVTVAVDVRVMVVVGAATALAATSAVNITVNHIVSLIRTVIVR